MSGKTTELLEALKEKVECSYLSDLKEMDIFFLKTKLKQLCIYDYPLEAWNRAISYLEKHPISFRDAKELSRYLTCGNGCHKFLEGRASEDNERDHDTDDSATKAD